MHDMDSYFRNMSMILLNFPFFFWKYQLFYYFFLHSCMHLNYDTNLYFKDLKYAYNQDVFLIKKSMSMVCLKTRCVTNWDALVLATLRYMIRRFSIIKNRQIVVCQRIRRNPNMSDWFFFHREFFESRIRGHQQCNLFRPRNNQEVIILRTLNSLTFTLHSRSHLLLLLCFQTPPIGFQSNS